MINPSPGARALTVLVIDDSAVNRMSIARLLESAQGLEVIDRAADGEEGLKKAIALRPDVITLDLEMPKLDGYSFLRLLMASAPTPVIVLSAYNHPSDVFKALELGAFDFVAKPATGDRYSLAAVGAELIEKVRSARLARRDPSKPKTSRARVAAFDAVDEKHKDPLTIIGIGASTGGPPAIERVLEGLAGLRVCVLVAQHMPTRFTEAFAQRLDATLSFRVTEARSGALLAHPHVYIAPGGTQLEVVEFNGKRSLNVTPATGRDLHAPSVDRLFTSLARTVGASAKALVLTGMGDDGAVGVRALGAVGAEVWAEAESSAVVFGMPQAALDTGHVTHCLPLTQLVASLANAVGPPSQKTRRRT